MSADYCEACGQVAWLCICEPCEECGQLHDTDEIKVRA